jgi:predicted ATPase
MKMSKEYSREWKRKKRLNDDFRNRELERNREWRLKNSDSVSKQKKEYYEQNKEKIKQRKRELYRERRERIVSWEQELTSLVKAEAKDLVKKRQKETDLVWSVDHIIPIKGKNVSGLDVWNNLQVIPLSENKRKHNSYEDCS